MVIYLVSTLLHGCSETVTSMQLIKHAILVVATAKEFESPTKNFVRALIMHPRGKKIRLKIKRTQNKVTGDAPQLKLLKSFKYFLCSGNAVIFF